MGNSSVQYVCWCPVMPIVDTNHVPFICNFKGATFIEDCLTDQHAGDLAPKPQFHMQMCRN